MIVTINGYELETENIVKAYPCDVLGNYQEQSEFTLIECLLGSKTHLLSPFALLPSLSLCL